MKNLTACLIFGFSGIAVAAQDNTYTRPDETEAKQTATESFSQSGYHKEGDVHKLEVGPFCSSEPYGATILVDRGAAWVISPTIDMTDTSAKPNDEALLPYPTSAPDGSYNTASWTAGGKPFTITYGKIDGHTVGMALESTETVDVTLRWRRPFSGCKTLFWEENGELHGQGINALSGTSYPLHVSAYPQMKGIEWNYHYEKSTVCHVEQGKPAVLVISIADEPSDMQPEDVLSILRQAKERYAKERVSAQGDWGDFAGAIAKSMNGSRLFSSLDRRIVHCIDRGWWIARQSPYTPGFVDSDDDQFAYFAWDSFLNANLASLEDPAAARETVRAMLSLPQFGIRFV